MKRKIVLYIAVLAIIIGGAPYLTGMLVEAKFKDVVKVLSDVDSAPINITLTEYERGWTKSHAKTKLTFFVNNKEYNVMLEHEIRHGPFVQVQDKNYRDWHFARALIHSKILLNEQAQKVLITELGQTELFNINSEMAITGAVIITVDGKELKLKEHDGTPRVAWKGIHGQWNLNSDLQHLTGEIIVPGIDIDLDGIHYFMQDFNYKTELSRTAQGLWPGKFMGTLNKLNIENPALNSILNLEGISTSGLMEVQEGMADFSGMLRIEKFTVNGKQYGPIDVSNSLKHVETHFLRSFFLLLQKKKVSRGIQLDVDVQDLINLLPELLKYRPEYSIEQLQIHTADGDVKGALNFAIGGPQAYDIKNIPQILQSIVAGAHLILPKPVLRDILTYKYTKNAQVANEAAKKAAAIAQSAPASAASLSVPKVLSPQEIAQRVEQEVNDSIVKRLKDGTLIEKDQNYYTEIILEKGKFSINGHPMNFGQQSALPTPPAGTQ